MLPLLLFAAGIAQLGVGWWSLPKKLPENYSFFEGKYRKCMREPSNQSDVCDSCVPFAFANHLTHRVCKTMVDIGMEPYLPGKREGRVSYQMLLSCLVNANLHTGCNGGGTPNEEFMKWFVQPRNRILLNECVPYTEETWKYGDAQSEKCPVFQSRIRERKRYPDDKCYHWVHADLVSDLIIAMDEVNIIKRMIYHDGPVVSSIAFDDNTNKFQGPGIYNGASQGRGKHYMAYVGWGVENGVKYWIVENSWGAQYEPFDKIHNRGFFRIKMRDESPDDFERFIYATSWSTNLY